MKIKHWQGYGTVQARKLSSTADTLVVEVWGNHEWGLERDDKMDVFDWLVRRFDKKHTDWTDIEDLELHDYYEKEGGCDVEHCRYVIRFRNR